MKRVFSIAIVLVFATVAVGSAWAKGGSGSHSHSSSSGMSISKQSSTPKFYMGGTPSGCAPKGTPENPNSKNCGDCCKDSCDHCCHDHDCCHDHCGNNSPPGVIVDPVHHPKFPINNLNPIMSPPNLAPTGGTTTTTPGGLKGFGGVFGGVTVTPGATHTGPGGLSGIGGALGGVTVTPGTPSAPTSGGPITGTNPGHGGNLLPF